MHVLSGTSGNKLPAKLVIVSWWRRFFLLPDHLVIYLGSNFKGSYVRTRWMYGNDVISD